MNSVMHGATFAVLASLVLWASSTASLGGVLLWGLGVSAYGGITEWLQSYVPNRTADWTDALENVVGAILGCLIVTIWRRLAHLFRGAEKDTV